MTFSNDYYPIHSFSSSSPTKNSSSVLYPQVDINTLQASCNNNGGTTIISSPIDLVGDLMSDSNKTGPVSDSRSPIDLSSRSNSDDHQQRRDSSTLPMGSDDSHLSHSSAILFNNENGKIPAAYHVQLPLGPAPCPTSKINLTIQTDDQNNTSNHISHPTTTPTKLNPPPQVKPPRASKLPSSGNSLANKKGKPLAKCSYCGMTFKKLEHCQRHERTHTLARPYSCSVCLKTFARQDTLNRHLRLHSRSDARMSAITKSPRQTQASPETPFSSGLLISPACKPSGPPIRPSSDILTLSQSFHTSSPHLRPRIARERGLSLSALEQIAFPSDFRQGVCMAGNHSRQSISLPLHRSQYHQLHQQLPSEIHRNPSASYSSSQITPTMSIQTMESSPARVYDGADGQMESRRGSWCSGAPNLGVNPTLSSSEPIYPSNRNYRQQAHQLGLGMENWVKNMSNSFGLVGDGIEPVPMSAPATCTHWSTLSIGSGAPSSSSSLSTASLAPAWDTFSILERQSHNAPAWYTLGPLEEEDQTKLVSEPISRNTSQLILSSPSQPDSLDQLDSLEYNHPTGKTSASFSTSEFDTTPSICSSLPPGQNLNDQYSAHDRPTSQPEQPKNEDLSSLFTNQWQRPEKQQTETIFDSVNWHEPVCGDSQVRESKTTDGSDGPNTNGLLISNPWSDMLELGTIHSQVSKPVG